MFVPCEVGEVRVDRRADDLTADLPEVFSCFAERDDLRGAHKGEVQRIEEEHHVLPCIKKNR